jgi:hypothetical protein
MFDHFDVFSPKWRKKPAKVHLSRAFGKQRLWQLIQSLPPLISSSAPSETTEGAILHFTKKTAIELLGSLA